ncbi:MAG: hypothetical protein HKN80_13080 [Acidimicrobiia bacterium]|nr:hypothetical protein [Acidimicrobiia bacterium]
MAVRRQVQAPRSAVWAVLADFPNIADWNSGVGARRHCDLAPMGALEETISEWVPESRMVVRIDSAAKLPIKEGVVTFSLEERDGLTPTEVRYAYQPKFGVLGSMMGPVLDRQLT